MKRLKRIKFINQQYLQKNICTYYIHFTRIRLYYLYYLLV